MRRATNGLADAPPQEHHFYPRSPCGERLIGPLIFSVQPRNFYPRSPCGERQTDCGKSWRKQSFLSTLSLRRATYFGLFFSRHAAFLSTLSLRRATERGNQHQASLQHFYPRSPCGERRVTSSTVIVILRISIHALLAESDRHPQTSSRPHNTFLSTLSLRRATKRIRHRREKPRHFYPRSPCGERRFRCFIGSRPVSYFYPRSPCGERRSLPPSLT